MKFAVSSVMDSSNKGLLWSMGDEDCSLQAKRKTNTMSSKNELFLVDFIVSLKGPKIYNLPMKKNL